MKSANGTSYIFHLNKHAVIRKNRAKWCLRMLFASFSIHEDVDTTAGSLIWRKYCTKVMFRQTWEVGFLNTSLKTICHSLSPDFWIMSSLGCPIWDWLRMKPIAQMRRLDVSILTSRWHTSTPWPRTVWHCHNLLETTLKTFSRPNMVPKLFGYYQWRHVSF